MGLVEQFVGGLVKVAPIVAVVVAYMSIAPEYLGLDVAMVVAVGVTVGIYGVILFLFTKDVDEEFDELDDSIATLRVEMNEGFDRTVTAIREASGWNEGAKPQTDGGTVSRATSDAATPQTDGGTVDRHGTTDAYIDGVEPDAPSGAGTLGGAVAGGMLGAPFGPAGVLVCGVVGSVVGNAVEFRKLRKRKRAKIRDAAWTVVRTRATPAPLRGEFLGATEGTDGGGDYWALEFEDETGRHHAVRLSLDDGRFVYRGRTEP